MDSMAVSPPPHEGQHVVGMQGLSAALARLEWKVDQVARDEKQDLKNSVTAGRAASNLSLSLIAQEAAAVLGMLSMPVTAALNLLAMTTKLSFGLYGWLFRRLTGRQREGGESVPEQQAQAPAARTLGQGVQRQLGLGLPQPQVGLAQPEPAAQVAQGIRGPGHESRVGQTLRQAALRLGPTGAALGVTLGGLGLVAGLPVLGLMAGGLALGGLVVGGAGVVATRRAARRARAAAPSAQPAWPVGDALGPHVLERDRGPGHVHRRATPAARQPTITRPPTRGAGTEAAISTRPMGLGIGRQTSPVRPAGLGSHGPAREDVDQGVSR
jgi:hypothetical protein